MAETYQGVKFSVIFRDVTPPRDPRLSILMNWCRIFDRYNLAPPYEGGAGSYGNLSFRSLQDKDSFIITGSRIGLKSSLDATAFVLVHSVDPLTGTVTVTGTRNPSSETMLHSALYKAFPEIGAVFHGHSPEILARAAECGLPCTEKEAAYGTSALVAEVLAVIGGGNVVIMRNHGFITTGYDMEEAGRRALSLL